MTFTHIDTMLDNCIERITALGLKGKKRDDEALTYICAYEQALLDAGVIDSSSPWPFLVSIRGYKQITDGAAARKKEKAKAETP